MVLLKRPLAVLWPALVLARQPREPSPRGTIELDRGTGFIHQAWDIISPGFEYGKYRSYNRHMTSVQAVFRAALYKH
ncbi:unnamed protein product [Peronospora belbahrii]|uniref:Uncharacterized protein n=1 Tax=Peronospora belbahrii TaxID=622444 RepID=A0AAU9L1X6_9STRA|nr:unnamed protein product [Peronospora belbahrii]CAH0515130.1 unnamed protein product [Peronospora belbahrii]